MKAFHLIPIMAVVMLFLPISVRSQVQQPADSVVPSGIIATLYDGEGRPVSSIEYLASSHRFLYVALLDAEGNQIVDIWDTAYPSAPALADSIDFGTVVNRPDAFSPVAILPFDDTVIIQANASLNIYRRSDGGSLTFLESVSPVSEYGTGQMTQLYSAGMFGSHEQEVVGPGFYENFDIDELNQQVFINFTDPEHPFLIRSLQNEGMDNLLANPGPLNAVFKGEPAAFAIDYENNTALLRVFHPAIDAHIDGFWKDAYENIFQASSLDTSLASTVTTALDGLDLQELFSLGVDTYASGLDIRGSTLESLILRYHDRDIPLSDVLAEYGIAPGDSLAVALSKLAHTGFDADIEAEISAMLFGDPFTSLFDSILPVSVAGDIEQLAASIESSLNAYLDADVAGGISAVERYLVERLLGPMMGEPAFLYMTFGDVIAQMDRTGICNIIEVCLTYLDGPFSVNDALGWVDTITGGALPDCASFPTDCGDLVDLIFYRSADIDPDGYAIIELLKFYRYLQGDTDYDDYLHDIEEHLRTMHAALAENITRRLSSAFTTASLRNSMQRVQAQSGDTSLYSLLEEFSSGISSRHLIAQTTAHQLIARFIESGLSTDATVADFLSHNRLYLDGIEEPVADIGDLLSFMSENGLTGLSVESLFDAAGSDISLYERSLQQVLRRHMQTVFGPADFDTDLRRVADTFFSTRIDLASTVAFSMEQILGDIVDVHMNMPSIGGLLTLSHGDFDDDCIALWLDVLKAAELVMAPLGLSAYPLALHAALTEGYDMAVDYVASVLLHLFISEIMDALTGDWPSLPSQMTVTDYRISYDIESDVYGNVLDACVWNNRVCLITEKLSVAFPGQRTVYLLVFTPGENGASPAAYDLGIWEASPVVCSADGALYLGGSFFTDSDDILSSGQAVILDITADEPTAQIISGRGHGDVYSGSAVAAAGGGTLLAVATSSRVVFLPNPVHFVEPDDIPPTVGMVNASNGLHPDHVAVSWSPLAGDAQYRVYRSSTESSDDAVAISAWIDDTRFNDSTAEAPQATGGACKPPTRVEYYYYVKARYGEREGRLSRGDIGWRGRALDFADNATARAAASDGTTMLLVFGFCGILSGRIIRKRRNR